MADRKAVNKYYPPDWDPSKGSINTYNKSHPLRARAKKIDKGILVVRFEMPFSIWCLKCENHIGMGVRYNAEKSKVGNYYTSPIYQFKMKCHLCDNFFEIVTDPSKFDYVVKSGARRQVRMSDKADEEEEPTETINLDAAEEAKRRVTDSMFRLEKRIEDKMKSEAELPNLRDIKKWRDKWEDDFSMNQLVRSQYRVRRKRLEQNRDRDRRLLKKSSLKIPLKKPSSSDVAQAKKLLSESKKRATKLCMSGPSRHSSKQPEPSGSAVSDSPRRSSRQSVKIKKECE